MWHSAGRFDALQCCSCGDQAGRGLTDHTHAPCATLPIRPDRKPPPPLLWGMAGGGAPVAAADTLATQQQRRGCGGAVLLVLHADAWGMQSEDMSLIKCVTCNGLRTRPAAGINASSAAAEGSGAVEQKHEALHAPASPAGMGAGGGGARCCWLLAAWGAGWRAGAGRAAGAGFGRGAVQRAGKSRVSVAGHGNMHHAAARSCCEGSPARWRGMFAD